MSASRGNGAATARLLRAGAIADDDAAARNLRRVIVMAWFPKLCRTWERFANLPHQGVRSNRHGKSIMIDRRNA
jgi:hypothetical protein